MRGTRVALFAALSADSLPVGCGERVMVDEMYALGEGTGGE